MHWPHWLLFRIDCHHSHRSFLQLFLSRRIGECHSYWPQDYGHQGRTCKRKVRRLCLFPNFVQRGPCHPSVECSGTLCISNYLHQWSMEWQWLPVVANKCCNTLFLWMGRLHCLSVTKYPASAGHLWNTKMMTVSCWDNKNAFLLFRSLITLTEVCSISHP